MKDQHEFDEQVRRKLEEREFAFQETDWLAAQELIKGSRNRRGAWLSFLLAGAGLIIAGAGVWWYTTSDTITEEQGVVVVENHDRESAPNVQVQVDKNDAKQINASSEAHESISTEATSATNGNGDVNTEKTLPSQPKGAKNINADVAQHAVSATTGSKSIPSGGKASGSKKNDTHTPDVKASTTHAEASGTGKIVGLRTSSATGNTSTDKDMNATLPVVAGAVASSMDTPTASPKVGITSTDDTSMDITASEAGVSKDESSSVMTDPAAATASAPKDSTGQKATEPTSPTAQDSAAATIDPLLAAATGPSPWEISAMVGAILTGSTYSGRNSADWTSGLSDRWTGTAGAEAMHLGRNFGIGTGLHYSTYEDDLHVDERSLTNTVITDSSYFQPTAVTLLYVVGNVLMNGQEYYVTQNRDTVINVWVNATTSSTNTIRLIDASDVVLSASYFEIPLLLDAHVTQGPWAIGLRGGPTIGLLSGRKGLVPNSSFDGYESLGEQQFRSTVFGLTARAYFRYRFLPGWSVGLEPTWRQQLSNAMENGDLERRSSSMGVLFSLNYRLK